MRRMGRQMALLGSSEPPPSLSELALSSDKHIRAPLPGFRRTCSLSLTCKPPEFTQPHAQVYKVGGNATHPLTSYVTQRRVRVSSWVGDAHNPLVAPRPTLIEIHKRWCLASAGPLLALCGPLTRAKMWVLTPSGASTSWWGTSVCRLRCSKGGLAIMASVSRVCYRGVETRTLRRTVHRRDFTMSMALRNQSAIFG